MTDNVEKKFCNGCKCFLEHKCFKTFKNGKIKAYCNNCLNGKHTKTTDKMINDTKQMNKILNKPELQSKITNILKDEIDSAVELQNKREVFYEKEYMLLDSKMSKEKELYETEMNNMKVNHNKEISIVIKENCILKDLNKDLKNENEDLKKQLEELKKMLN